MSSTLIWGGAAILVVILVGLAVRWATLPFPEIAISEATWETFNGPDYYAWSEANPEEGWFMVQRREDGDYHMTFRSRGAARRFRERWLEGCPKPGLADPPIP